MLREQQVVLPGMGVNTKRWKYRSKAELRHDSLRKLFCEGQRNYVIHRGLWFAFRFKYNVIAR